MKKDFGKKMWKKFFVAIMVVISCCIIAPGRVEADAADVAGTLAEPIADLVLGIGDAVVDIATKYIIHAKKDYCPNCEHFWTNWLYAEDYENKTDYDEKVKSGKCPNCRWRLRTKRKRYTTYL